MDRLTDDPECKLTPEQREKYDLMYDAIYMVVKYHVENGVNIYTKGYKQGLEDAVKGLEDAVKELANEVQG